MFAFFADVAYGAIDAVTQSWEGSGSGDDDNDNIERLDSQESKEEDAREDKFHTPRITVGDLYDIKEELPERELISVFGKKLYQHISKLDPPYRIDGMEFGLKHCMIAAWMSKSGLYFVNIQKKLKISGKGDFSGGTCA